MSEAAAAVQSDMVPDTEGSPQKGLYIDRVRPKILGTSAGKWEGQGSGAQVSGRDPGAVP